MDTELCPPLHKNSIKQKDKALSKTRRGFVVFLVRFLWESGGAVHAVGGHIVVEHFAVLLFFLLDVVEGIADVLVGEFENAGIVEMRGMLFDGEGVGAEIFIVLLITFRAVAGGEGGHGFAAARRRRNGAGADLIQGVQMLVFRGRHLRKKILQLGILGALGVTGIFVSTKLLLVLHVLEKGGFFLGQL